MESLVVLEVGGTYHMELTRLQCCLTEIEGKGVKPSTLVTDRHTYSDSKRARNSLDYSWKYFRDVNTIPIYVPLEALIAKNSNGNLSQIKAFLENQKEILLQVILFSQIFLQAFANRT